MRIFLLIFLSLLFSFNYSDKKLDIVLSKANKFENKKLPDSANTLLLKLKKNALDSGKSGYYLLAEAKLILNSVNKFKNNNEKKILEFNKIINKIPKKYNFIVNAILGNWYWQFYKKNQWQFSKRTKTVGLSNPDFTTWDSVKILKLAQKHFVDSLKDAKKLKNTKVTEYYPLIRPGNYFGNNKETLYEFITRELLTFYSENKTLISAPQDEFEILSSSDAYADNETFIKYRPVTTDKTSFKLKSILLFQQLLEFYNITNNDLMFVDTDIKRLKYVLNEGVGVDRQELFVKRLKELQVKFKNTTTIALASYERAIIAKKNHDYLKAKSICDKTLAAFSSEKESNLCFNLIQSITKIEYSANIEFMINKDNSYFEIKYKNINKVKVRIYKDDPNKYLRRKWGKVQTYLKRQDATEMLSTKPYKRFTQKLKATKDFHYKTQVIKLPKLTQGLYRVFISHNNSFNKDNNSKVEYGTFLNSNITAVVRNLGSDIKGLVLNSHTGTPIKNAKVQFFKKNKEGFYKVVEEVESKKNGRFKLSQGMFSDTYNSYLLKIISGDDSFFWNMEIGHANKTFTKSKGKKIQFFTDRSIYRLGQKIKFKGICYEYDQADKSYETFVCKNHKVYLKDVNGKTVKTLEFNANEFGSFSGDLLIPKDSLTGVMNLTSSIPGRALIRVEQYKRPKFEVILEQLKQQYVVNETIPVKGSAVSFSGVPVSSAKVKYRVVRGTKLPGWWRWFNPYANKVKEVANGLSKTNDDGEFVVNFTAQPDKQIDAKTSPQFTYTIFVDVIDPTGETRSSQIKVNVGHRSIEASISTKTWLPSNEKTQFSIKTQTLDGEFVDTEGQILIYKLKNPVKIVRKSSLKRHYSWHGGKFDAKQFKQDKADYHNWDLGKRAVTESYKTKVGIAKVSTELGAGAYRAFVITKDKYGKEVKSQTDLIVFSKDPSKITGFSFQDPFPINIPFFVSVKGTTLIPGEKFEALWATGYKDAQAKIIISQDQKILKSYWTKKGLKTHLISYPIDESLQGGFNLEVLFVRDNQIYKHSQVIKVTRPQKNLKLSFTTFRSKLSPGAKETWVIKIEGDNALKISSEIVATMYDASLDQISPHTFMNNNWEFWTEGKNPAFRTNLFSLGFQGLTNSIPFLNKSFNQQFSYFDHNITNHFSRHFAMIRPRISKMFKSKSRGMGHQVESFGEVSFESSLMSKQGDQFSATATNSNIMNKENNVKFKVRSNLSETAFFYPQLISDKNGLVEIKFEMPDSLTKWKFMAFAHGKLAETGILGESIVTQKKLMVTPNAPRFVRQGDLIYFTSKLSNMSESSIDGVISLELENGNNSKKVQNDFIKSNIELKYKLAAGKSKVFSWKLDVPDVTYPLIYRVIAQSHNYSDGEEGVLPILARSILVKESIPLWISDKGSKEFKFKNLLASHNSKTLKHQALVVQMVANPSWYVVQALPFIDQTKCECLDGSFNRFYANSLGRFILQQKPEIEKVFKKWRGNNSLKSNLNKNSKLKSLSLDGTPWLQESDNEEENKKKIANFFNRTALKYNIHNSLGKLRKNKLSDGGWSWFPGGKKRSDYITLHILTGFARLRSLGVKADMDMALESIHTLDNWIERIYNNLTHKDLGHNSYGYLISKILYARSFYLKDKPILKKYKKFYDFFFKQAEKYWPKLNSRLSEAHTASAALRFNKNKITEAIIKSLRQRALHSDELGMYWEESESSYYWYQAPIATQAQIIELFGEIGAKAQEIDQLKLWLVKQKQTQSWGSSKSTTNAVYSLLLNGSDWLKDKSITQVKLGKYKIKPSNIEDGSGMYIEHISKESIKASMGNIEVSRETKGVSWGGVHWQYFEDISKISTHSSPLSVEKILYVRRNDKQGPKLLPLKDINVEVGDTIVSRIIVKTDRDMEFIHLKDMRGSGMEPLNVLSQYSSQNGLFYYESTKDTASHYYFDFLPKGTYVFEYDSRIFHKGEYQTGYASIQSFYAPEFSSHSKSTKVIVK